MPTLWVIALKRLKTKSKVTQPGTAARLRNSLDNASTCPLVGTCTERSDWEALG